jgi:3-phenylpropionate/trans-cinnamate dioxygenase ferredoxin reductase subunit
MLGRDEDYERLPYFFTDQYDLGMEYVGSLGPDGYDDVVVRGDLTGEFTAFWLRAGRVEAGMHVNDWDAIDSIRRLVGAAVPLDRLRDESVALSALVP